MQEKQAAGVSSQLIFKILYHLVAKEWNTREIYHLGSEQEVWDLLNQKKKHRMHGKW